MAVPDIGDRIIKLFGFKMKDTLDSHKGFFCTRRAVDLLLTNPTWETESDLHSLKQRLTTEMNAVSTYLGPKLGTRKTAGTIGGPTEAGAPAALPKTQEFVAPKGFHLDLSDVAATRDDIPDEKVKSRRSAAVKDRRRRIQGIVWRAAAIHPDVRQGADIDTLAMNELLDRRLRAVERMAYQVSRRQLLGATGLKAPPGTSQGPWTDHMRVRPFEYPRVSDKENLPDVIAAVGPEHVLRPGSPAFQTAPPAPPALVQPWLLQFDGLRIHYNVPPSPGLQLRTGGVRENWKGPLIRGTDKDPYELHLAPVAPTTAAQAMDAIFESKFDWWQRSWLFCDHVLSAIQAEALLFALRRRSKKKKTPPADPDTEFNTLAQNEYVQLMGHVTLVTTPGILMSDANDKYFENTNISPSELQIGDHVIFLNSFLHKFLVRDEWGLENAFIVDLKSAKFQPDHVADKFQGGVVRNELVLQGHGIVPTPYSKYAASLTKSLNKQLRNLRTEIKAQPAGTTQFAHSITGYTVIRWEPKAPFPDPGAWWLVLDTQTTSRWTSPAQIQLDIPKVIIAADATNVTTPFPTQFAAKAAFFPLYEPKVARTKGKSAWQSYLDGSKPTKGSKLVEVTATGDLIPGMFLSRGNAQASGVFLVRPLVRPIDDTTENP